MHLRGVCPGGCGPHGQAAETPAGAVLRNNVCKRGLRVLRVRALLHECCDVCVCLFAHVLVAVVTVVLVSGLPLSS